MNYQQLATLTYERQATLLAEADQRRLAKRAVAGQRYPIRVWIAQRLIALGQRWSGDQVAPTLTTQPVAR